MTGEQLSNGALLAALETAMKKESVQLASVIAMLVEVQERRLDLEHACRSLFEFCTRRLGMSEGQAFRRSTAAKLVKRFPPLLDAIRNRQILISNLVLIRHVITTDNVHQLIASISGRSRREVEALVASLAPKPDVPASIRRTPVRSCKAAAASRPADPPLVASALAPCTATANSLASTLSFGPVPSGASGSERASSITVDLAAHATPAPDASRQFALGPVLARESTASLAPSSGAVAEPATGTRALTSNVPGRPSVSAARSIPVREQLTQLSEARHKVQFTVSTEQREKIERAQRLAKTTNFDGDIATLMEAAMDLLIAKLEKQKLATTSRPRKSAGAARKVEASASDPPAALPPLSQRKRRPRGHLPPLSQRKRRRPVMEPTRRSDRALRTIAPANAAKQDPTGGSCAEKTSWRPQAGACVGTQMTAWPRRTSSSAEGDAVPSRRDEPRAAFRRGRHGSKPTRRAAASSCPKVGSASAHPSSSRPVLLTESRTRVGTFILVVATAGWHRSNTKLTNRRAIAR